MNHIKNEAEIPVDVYRRYGRSPKPVAKPTGTTWETRNVSAWNVKGMLFALNRLYQDRTKGALLVLGSAGIGKSQVVRQFAINMAEKEGRQYRHLADLRDEDRVEIIRDPSKYYVFLDLRAGELNPEQASGIPDVEYGKMKGYLRFLPPDWAALISNPNFSGLVFLDELNRGQESVINSLFQFVLDRTVSGRRVSDNVSICAAANFGEGFAGTAVIDSALMSRFDVGVLVADAEEWAEWARKNNVSNYIIDYALSNPAENFYGNGKDIQEGNIPLNPRQLERASMLLKQVEAVYANASKGEGNIPDEYSGNIYDDIANAIKVRLPNDWVNNFVQWLEIVHAFEWAEIVSIAKAGGYKSKSGAKAQHEITGSKKWALTRYITNEVIRRFDIARQNKDEAEQKRLLGELYSDLYYIFAGVDMDNVSFIVKSLVNAIKHNPPAGISPLQAAENWNLLMTPIAKKANADNPEFFKKLKGLMEELGKIKK